jgi:hypothetical protein
MLFPPFLCMKFMNPSPEPNLNLMRAKASAASNVAQVVPTVCSSLLARKPLVDLCRLHRDALPRVAGFDLLSASASHLFA